VLEAMGTCWRGDKLSIDQLNQPLEI